MYKTVRLQRFGLTSSVVITRDYPELVCFFFYTFTLYHYKVFLIKGNFCFFDQKWLPLFLRMNFLASKGYCCAFYNWINRITYITYSPTVSCKMPQKSWSFPSHSKFNMEKYVAFRSGKVWRW